MFKPDLNIKLFFRIYDAKSGDHLIPGGGRGGGGGQCFLRKKLFSKFVQMLVGK